MKVPWETIIKVYGRKLGTTKFDTLEQYAEDFLNFLAQKGNPLFPESQQETYLDFIVTGNLLAVRNEIGRRVSTLAGEGEMDDAQTTSVVLEVIGEYLADLGEIDDVPSVGEGQVGDIIEKYGEIIEETIEEVFGDLPVSGESRILLGEVCRLVLSKGTFLDPDLIHEIGSGIVIAGFGENEIFPSCYAYDVQGVIDGHLIYAPQSSYHITFDDRAIVRSFAQTEMVHTFMDGIDPSYREAILEHLTRLLQEHAETVLDKIPQRSESDRARLLEELMDANEELIGDFFEKLLWYQRLEHSNPVMFAVAHLPKDELATMAESLVNITAFKRRVSVEAETVGGPIDVAVISKGDGFVWIKRKRYFEAEKNPHFFADDGRE